MNNFSMGFENKTHTLCVPLERVYDVPIFDRTILLCQKVTGVIRGDEATVHVHSNINSLPLKYTRKYQLGDDPLPILTRY